MRHLDLHGHFSEVKTDRLKGGERLAIGLAVFGITNGRFQRSTRNADRKRRNRNAPVRQQGEGFGVSPALFSEHVGGGHAEVVQLNLGCVGGVLPQLIFNAQALVTRIFRIGDEEAEAVAFALVGGRGHHQCKTGFAPIRDPLLAAVDHIVIAIALGRGANGGGIGASMGL